VRYFCSSKRFSLEVEYGSEIVLLSGPFLFKREDSGSSKNGVKIWVVLRSIFAQARGFSLKQK